MRSACEGRADSTSFGQAKATVSKWGVCHGDRATGVGALLTPIQFSWSFWAYVRAVWKVAIQKLFSSLSPWSLLHRNLKRWCPSLVFKSCPFFSGFCQGWFWGWACSIVYLHGIRRILCEDMEGMPRKARSADSVTLIAGKATQAAQYSSQYINMSPWLSEIRRNHQKDLTMGTYWGLILLGDPYLLLYNNRDYPPGN